MSTYLIPIETAILTFPIIAAIMTIPYILVQYRKYGSILPLRVAIVYSFVFYLLVAYFLVILPLPPIEEVAQYTSPTTQLIPFECIREFSMSSSLVLQDSSTYLKALNEPSLFLILFNILLTVPFGMYLRYYFACSWKKTLLFSFLLSLSFECIQLSALFGIYPRPYRLFDVDDLINNTLGGGLGYMLTPLISWFLPSRSTLDETSMLKGRQVSSLRRICAFFIDFIIVALASAITLFIGYIMNFIDASSISTNILYIYATFTVLFIIIFSIIFKGKTLGKALVKIRLVSGESTLLKWYQHIIHYVVLYLCILPMPYIIFLNLLDYFDITTSSFSISILLIALMIVFYIVSLVQCVRSLFVKEHYAWYDKHWKLHNISTIPYEETDDNVEIEGVHDGCIKKTNPNT
ncbi:MAG: VanZ family protein [Longicatena sp.]